MARNVCAICGGSNYNEWWACCECHELCVIKEVVNVKELLAKAKALGFQAPTRCKLAGKEPWILGSEVPVIAIEDLEQIIKELLDPK